MNFSNLLKNHYGITDFWDKNFERDFCHFSIQEKSSEIINAKIIDFESINDLFSRRDLNADMIHLFSDQGAIPQKDYTRDTIYGKIIDNNKLFDHFIKGNRIRIYRPDYSFPKLFKFCRNVENELNVRIFPYMFITPPHENGIRIHYDKTDFFALQIYGSKNWSIYNYDHGLPIKDYSHLAEKEEFYNDIEHKTIITRQGDFVYFPRGIAHKTTSPNEISVHISFNFDFVTHYEVLKQSLTVAKDRMEFRKSIPYPLLNNIQQEIKKQKEYYNQLDLNSIFKEAYENNRVGYANRMTDFRNRLSDIFSLQEDDLGPESRILRRLDIHCITLRSNQCIELSFYEKTLVFPEIAINAIQKIISLETFVLDEICDKLDLDNKIALVFELIEEGLLSIGQIEND